MGEKIRSRDKRIERLHLIDLDIAPLDGETVEAACAELTTGLLVQHTVLIDPSGGADTTYTGGWPVVRFTGPRSQLEELLNRYDGVPGAFNAAPWNPDPAHTVKSDGWDSSSMG